MRIAIVIVLMNLSWLGYGQTNAGIQLGWGFLDQSDFSYFLGTRVNHNRLHASVNVGSGFRKGFYHLNVAGDIAYHFGMDRPVPEQRRWYTSLGMSYTRWVEYSSDYQKRTTFVNLRIGRDHYITSKTYLGWNLGVNQPIINRTWNKPPCGIICLEGLPSPVFTVSLNHKLME